ncbi:MAG: NAD(P)-dependent oxidoreductase [Candidatus Methylacidiphilales bacterium]|nr:NAD(P)-dependent oxidoreductase [Candidatus Methylacidiphilales bacterium]
MKIILIGANGFVGSAFHRLLASGAHELIPVTRANYAAHVGTPADLVIEAACNSKKFFAEEKPFEEFDTSVGHRLRTLRDFPAAFHLHVSSVDVYADLTSPSTTRESTVIPAEQTSYYGLHKWMAEELVRKYAKGWLIVRLAGMVGPGLRKNPVYDILHGLPLRIHPDSRYQFLSTEDAARLSWTLFEKGAAGEVVNICGQGTVTPRRVAEMAGRTMDLSALPPDAKPRIVDVSVDKLLGILPVPRSVDTVAEFIARKI